MAKATTERKDGDKADAEAPKTTRTRRRTTTKAKPAAQTANSTTAKTASAPKTAARTRTTSTRSTGTRTRSRTNGDATKAEASSAKADSDQKAATEEPAKKQTPEPTKGEGESKSATTESDTADVAGPDGIDMFPPLVLEVAGEKITFDMDDPKLPKAIEKRQFAASDYPYKKRMKKKEYEPALAALQAELVKLQAWMLETGERVMVVFEGRDAAGKGGTIKVIREFLNPRHAPIVALTAPTKTEQGQWYYQRYVEHFPTTGELVMFDRSWYNRGVVEPVMGYCTMPEHRHFLDHTPGFERQVVADGIHLFKFWLNIGRETQIKRFHDRRHNKLKVWKLSPNDVNSLHRWDDYTAARNRMIEATHIPEAPWTVVRANDKRRARINLVRSLLSRIDYEGRDDKAIGEVDKKIVGEGMSLFKS